MFRAVAAFIGLALLVTAVPSAKAEGNDAAGSTTHLHTSGGVLSLTGDEKDVVSKRISFELMHAPIERLTLRPFVRFNSTTVDLTRPDDQPFDARLVLPWQTSYGIGANVRLYRWKFLDLSTYGEMDIPTSTNTARISGLKLHNEGKEAVELDIDPSIVRDHVTVEYDWKRFDLGLSLRANTGIWHPFLDVGYAHMPGRLSVRFDGEAAALLGQFGADPRPSYGAGMSSVFYSAGIDIDLLGDDLTLRTRATVAPTKHGWLATGEFGLIAPVDILGGK
jgi:hypothetical protein